MLFQRSIFFSLLIILLPVLLSAQTPARDAYIERFRKIAISEMERTGIPASIKLAQGILESGDGKSTLARKANNHFGIKCHSNWKGKKHYIEDDDYDSNGKLIKSCFRVYKNADASYIAHSEFLRDPNKKYRYGFLFSIPITDYRSWARGLKEAGYATSPTYAEKLIRVIEMSELYRFDKMTTFDDVADGKEIEYQRLGIKLINDVKMTLAENGERPVDIAQRTRVSVDRILKYNEGITSKTQKLKKEARVFLQKKRNNYRGKKKWHYVQTGESMFDVSQLYGVKLNKLYEKNRMSQGQQPAVGERLKIRGWFKIDKDETPRTRRGEDDEIADVVEENNSNDDWMEDDDEIEIEIPISSTDDEVFDEDIVPETPDSEIFDDPVIESPDDETDETEQPDTGSETEPDTNPDTGPDTETDTPDTDSETGQPLGVYYTVVRGDTLFSISRKYGTTVEAIKRLNGLNTNVISINQRLRVF